jgi:hypothetical protein
MNTSVLLEKLVQIERSIGIETNNTLRAMVLDAQDCALALQKSLAQHLRAESRRAGKEAFSPSRHAH